MLITKHCLKSPLKTRVFDVNSSFKIKNPSFNSDLKNMTKLVHINTGWQWSSLRTMTFKKIQRPTFPTPAITLKIYGRIEGRRWEQRPLNLSLRSSFPPPILSLSGNSRAVREAFN